MQKMQVQAANVIDDNNIMTACGCVRACPALLYLRMLTSPPPLSPAGNQLGKNTFRCTARIMHLIMTNKKRFFRLGNSNNKHSNSSLQFWRAAAVAAETQQQQQSFSSSTNNNNNFSTTTCSDALKQEKKSITNQVLTLLHFVLNSTRYTLLLNS